jgi:hypothetical protein
LHPDSKVWFDGTYGRGERRRQRYKCLPREDARSHVFTEALPRTIDVDRECWECERPLAAHEGPPAPRAFEYTVREIAEALILVGRGMTYRGAGREVRALGSRRRRRRSDCRHPRREDGRTVAAWVELFAPAVFEAQRPKAWPPVVALDAKPFKVGGRRNAAGDLVPGGSPAFQVFAAMGYESYEAPVQLVGLQSFPGFENRQGRPYWVEFLRSLDAQLDGTPRQFVCDADPDIEAAIREVWPLGSEGAPEVFLCHHHLHDGLLSKLKDAHLAEDDPLYTAAREAFKNRECWDTFEREAQEHRPRIGPLSTWLRSYGNRAAYQVAHRGGRVTDTTAVERYLADVRALFGLRRAALRNRRRLDCLLMLMMLQQRQPASRSVYAHIIREQLVANGGHAPTRRELAARNGQRSLRLMPPPPRRATAPAPVRTPTSYPPDPDGDDIPF